MLNTGAIALFRKMDIGSLDIGDFLGKISYLSYFILLSL